MDPISDIKTLIQPTVASVASGASRALLPCGLRVKQIDWLGGGGSTEWWGGIGIARGSRDLCSRFKALYDLKTRHLTVYASSPPPSCKICTPSS